MRWNLLWQIFYANGRIFIGLSGQILKNSFAIWSHCHQRFPLNVFSAIEVIIQILTNGRIWIDRAAWNGWKSVLLLLLRRRWRWRRGIHLLHFRRYSSIQSCPNIKKLSPTRIHISKSFIFPHRVISYPHIISSIYFCYYAIPDLHNFCSLKWADPSFFFFNKCSEQ